MNLTDAIAQIQANIQAWDKEGAQKPENRDILEGKGVFTVQPKGIIVIGSLSELKGSRTKHETFQRFRKSIHGVDILTFDELHQRAKFIVNRKS